MASRTSNKCLTLPKYALNSETIFMLIGRVATSSMKMDFAQGYPGANGPELKNFDPLRFAEKSPEWLPWFREAELKHGRVAMLATLGWIAADFVKLPGDIHQVSSFEAHNVFVQSGGMVQILLWCGIIELITVPALRNMETSDRAPGNECNWVILRYLISHTITHL